MDRQSDNGAWLGIYFHPAILAGLDADYIFLSKVGMAAVLRFGFVCLLYPAGYHQFGIHICDSPANDSFDDA